MITTVVAIVAAVVSCLVTRHFNKKSLAKTVTRLKVDSEVVKYRSFKDGFSAGQKYVEDEIRLFEEMKSALKQ